MLASASRWAIRAAPGCSGRGVTPSALLALRFPATAASAFVVLALLPSGWPSEAAWLDAVLVIAALLIVLASFVNQVAISLASPLTVRVVLAVGNCSNQ